MKNILSLECVVDWFGTQKSEKRYNYTDSCSCALYQYFTHAGLPIQRMFMRHWEDKDDQPHPFNTDLDFIVSEPPYTFGAAHMRGLELIEFRKSQARQEKGT